MEDLTDNEREEQIRRWWSDNWLWIVGGVALGLALLWGWQYWQQSRLQRVQEEETAYSSVLDSLGASRFDEAVQKGKALRDAHPASPYADQADLAIARGAVEARKPDLAVPHLKAVADGSKDEQMRGIARARLARVLVEQGKFDEAAALLDPAKAGTFAALYHDIRGDAFAAKGDAASARREYEAAIAAAADGVQIDVAYVELKRDAMPAAAAPAAPPAPAQPAGTAGK